MLRLIDGTGGVILFIMLALCWHYVVYKERSEWGLIGYYFFVMFLSRGTIAILNVIFQILPIQRDALNYHNTVIMISEIFQRGDFAQFADMQKLVSLLEPGYTIALGFLYFLFGTSPLVGFIANTFFFSLTGLNVYRIAKLCFGTKAGKITAVCFLFLPYSMLHSTYLYRDPWINYFMSEIFYRLLLISQGHKLNLIQWLWLSFVILYTGILRRENLVILAAILCFLTYRRVLISSSFWKPLLITFTCIFCVGGALFIYKNTDNWLLVNFKNLVVVQALQERAEASEDVESAYLTNETYSSYTDLIKYAPIRAVYFLFSPFPWDIFKKSQYIVLVEAIFVGILILFLPGAFIAIKKANPTFFYSCGIYLIIGILGSGLIQSNSAAAQRHRTQFTFLIVAIALPYIYNRFISRMSLAGNDTQLK
jgi:hypothetical protein